MSVKPQLRGGPGAQRQRRLFDRQIRRAGRGLIISLRREHDLINRATGAAAVLVVSGDHLTGAVAISLAAPSLHGTIPAGIRLTLAGEQFEVQESIVAAGGALAAVPIEPALTADVADGTPVTVEAYRDYRFRAARSSQIQQMVDGAPIKVSSDDLVLSTAGAQIEPDADDKIVLSDGVHEIKRVVPVGESIDPMAWRVQRS